MKKSVAFLLLLMAAVAMFAVACGGEEDTGTTVEGDGGGTSSTAAEVTVALADDPGDLGPFVAMSLGRIGVLNTMYEFLYLEGTPVIAESFVAAEDGMSCVVTVRNNVKDSAGNAITAADVAWSYTSGMTAGNLRPLGDVESVTATGDYTVEMKFKKAMGERDLGDILGECPIVSQKAFEASDDEFATKPISTSMYVVTENVPGATLTFEKNADYWQTDESLRSPMAQANVDKIIFQVIKEAAQHSVALETGAIDISGNVAGTDIGRFEGNEDFMVQKVLDNLTQVVLFNGSEGNPFTSLELRQAVAYAIDSNAVGLGAAGENGFAVSHTIGNANFNGYLTKWDTQPYYEQDLAKAKELFTASGATSGMTARLLTQTEPKVVLMAQVIQAQLKELGITVEINSVEPAVFNDLKADPTAWDLCLDATAGGDQVYSPWALLYDATRYNGATSNFFVDPKLQELLAAAQADPSEANLDAFVAYDKENVYAYALLSWQNNYVAVSGVTEIALDKRGQIIPGACVYSPDFE